MTSPTSPVVWGPSADSSSLYRFSCAEGLVNGSRCTFDWWEAYKFSAKCILLGWESMMRQQSSTRQGACSDSVWWTKVATLNFTCCHTDECWCFGGPRFRCCIFQDIGDLHCFVMCDLVLPSQGCQSIPCRTTNGADVS